MSDALLSKDTTEPSRTRLWRNGAFWTRQRQGMIFAAFQLGLQSVYSRIEIYDDWLELMKAVSLQSVYSRIEIPYGELV